MLLLLGKGFFMGVFLATYKIVATTLFLNNMGEYLREALLVSGVLGVITTGFYAFVQTRIKYSRLAIFNLVVVFIFVAIARVFFNYAEANILIFALFVMLGPITSILFLGFWGIFGRLFDLRQSKRIIGGIDSGQLIATIFAYYTIPFLTNYITNITNFLIIGELSLVLSIVFIFLIVANYDLNAFHQRRSERPAAAKMQNLFKNRYIVFLAAFLFVSMLANTFMDYSFWNVTKMQYPDETQLASFLGVFEGSVMILGLLIQTFVNERLMSMYGLRTTLLILPLILLVFTGLALFSGHYFGFDVFNSNFIWFFLFISISALFTRTLREATENPVFKLFFMPLDNRIRFDVQAKVEGMVNEFARAMGGAIIFLLGYLPFIELIHYSWILLLIIGGWIFLAVKIYNLYKVNIRLKLEHQKAEADKIELKGKDLLIDMLEKNIEEGNPGRMVLSLKMLAKIAPSQFGQAIQVMRANTDSNINRLVLDRLEHDMSFAHTTNLANDDGGRSHKKSILKEIRSFKNSKETENRKLAAELIGVQDYPESVADLIELLNDAEPAVVKAAMMSAGQLRKMELLPFLLDNMFRKNLRETAKDALIGYGESAFTNLETLFYNNERDVEIKLSIVEIYGRVGGEMAIANLWSKINYPDKKIVSEILVALNMCNFKAKGDQIAQIKYVIEADVSSILWNFIAIEKLRASEDYDYEKLILTLRNELRGHYRHIYMLLSMIYDRKSIQLVEENIDSGTNEGVSYGIEMLDVFLSDDLKQRIIPLFDDIADIDRVRRLEMFHPQIDISEQDVIRFIINREFNTSNRWSKACALQLVALKGWSELYMMELIANLFNPDLLLCELAAWALIRHSKELYKENVQRLEPAARDHLNNVILGLHNEKPIELRPHLRFEIVDFLKVNTELGDLPDSTLVQIADQLEEDLIKANTRLDGENLSSDYYYILLHGAIGHYSDNGEHLHRYEIGYFLEEQIIFDLNVYGQYLLVEEDTVMLKIEKNAFAELMTTDYETAVKIMKILSPNTVERADDTTIERV